MYTHTHISTYARIEGGDMNQFQIHCCVYRYTWLINVTWFEHWTALLNNAAIHMSFRHKKRHQRSIDRFSISIVCPSIYEWISRSKTTVEVVREEEREKWLIQWLSIDIIQMHLNLELPKHFLKRKIPI